MARFSVSRCRPLACGTIVFSLAAAAPLLSQSPDSIAASTRTAVSGELVNELPLDRAVDVLRFLPGITTNNAGELLLRGGRPGDAALYLDGVPITSGFRSTAFFGLGLGRMLESQVSPAPTVAESVIVETGPLSAERGNGQAGAVSIHTRQPGAGITGRLDYETDEPFGSGHSFGLNRLEGTVEGSLGSRLGFLVGGMLEGQRSVDRGFGSEEAPVFVLAGVDTTLRVPSAFGDPFADTTSVDVYDFAVSRGRCDDFDASGDPDIARNYGFECQAGHTPGSAVSTYEVLGKLTYSFGRSRLSLLAVADQHQNRNFEYGTLYNTPGVTGNRTTSSVVILGWQQPLNGSSERPLLLDTHLSFQSDRNRSGPLAPDGAENTADPFGGFLIRPIDLRFDFDNFSVDEELVRNYRTNQVGSRRSPYDLENVAQYSEIDRYRNNAYGLYNRDPIAPTIFIDGGGPVGPLTLYRENRTLAAATLSWRPNASHRLQLGGEFTRYSIANYNHFLASQTFSDVYIEHPVRGALFLQDRVELGEAAITAGVRYDFYDTRARRPADFPRIATHPLFDPDDPDAFFNDDQLFPRDESHSYISPHLQANFAITPQTVFRGGIATQAQAPDFRHALRRINTDLAFTDEARTIFGSDLDFEHTTTFELGVWRALTNNLSVDLAIYSRNAKSQVITELTQRLDPLSGTNRNLLFHTNDGTEKVRGVDLKIVRGMGSALTGWLGYSYQDAESEQRAGLGEELSLPTLVSRPHSLTGALALTVPANWKGGSLAGAILANLGVYTTFRVASGTPYTRCPGTFGDQSVLSPDLCSTFTVASLNGSRLPTFKQLDLRIVKRFGPGGRFSGYIDARNALNFKNVLAVFAVNGETSNPVELSANWSADSADLASEAGTNGLYRPDGSINLGQGLPDPRVACLTWADATGTPAGPNCVYLVRAEERFGNGDHLFDVAEQRRASEALYRAVRGEQELTGPPRRVRLGLEVGF